MSEAVQLVLATTAINAAVTWGIVRTQIAWLRADVDEIKRVREAERLRAMTA